MRNILLGAGIALGAIALAVAGIEGARGRGAVQNAQGQRGQFGFEVRKAVDNGRIVGEFHFKMGGNDRRVEIDMPKALGFARDGRTAEFGGKARMVTIVGRNRVVREGNLRIRVADRTSPENPTGDPDRLGLQFDARGNFVFEFGGAVAEGDLVVFERER